MNVDLSRIYINNDIALLQVHNICSWCHTVVICVVVVVVTTQWGSLCWQLERCAISERVLTVGGGKLGQSRERESAQWESTQLRESVTIHEALARSAVLCCRCTYKNTNICLFAFGFENETAQRVLKSFTLSWLRLHCVCELLALSLFLSLSFSWQLFTCALHNNNKLKTDGSTATMGQWHGKSCLASFLSRPEAAEGPLLP